MPLVSGVGFWTWREYGNILQEFARLLGAADRSKGYEDLFPEGKVRLQIGNELIDAAITFLRFFAQRF